jgi:hypothetical protein
VGQRHAECRRLGDDAIGHRERIEVSAHRERVDGELRSGDELLDEHDLPTRRGQRRLERLGHVLCRRDHGQSALALSVRWLDHAWEAELDRSLLGVCRGGADPESVVRNAGICEPLALAKLRNRRQCHLRRQGMRDVLARRHAGGEADREVDARRDDAVHLLRSGEPVDRVLVLDGDDRAPVCVAEAWSRGIAVDGDDVDASLLRRLQQPELPGARP